MDLELNSLQEYETFVDKGKGYVMGSDYKKIKVLIVFAVKHDGRFKSRICAGGHLTDVPLDSVLWSGVTTQSTHGDISQ